MKNVNIVSEKCEKLNPIVSFNEVMENVGVYIPIQSVTMSKDNSDVRLITIRDDDNNHLHTFFVRMPNYLLPMKENKKHSQWEIEKFRKVNEQINITIGDL